MTTEQGNVGAIEVHDLKCWPEQFERLRRGYKTAEFRRNDRDFKVGQYLRLWEYDTTEGKVIARLVVNKVEPQVFVITDLERAPMFGIPPGFVMLSVTAVDAEFWGISTDVENSPQ